MPEESAILMPSNNTHEKSTIDLEYLVWQRLAGLAQRREITLSETIVQLIEDAERKEKYASQMSSLKVRD